MTASAMVTLGTMAIDPGRGPDHRRQPVSHPERCLPPALLPGEDPAGRPLLGVALQTGLASLGHRPQRVAHQVAACVEDGEAVPMDRCRVVHVGQSTERRVAHPGRGHRITS